MTPSLERYLARSQRAHEATRAPSPAPDRAPAAASSTATSSPAPPPTPRLRLVPGRVVTAERVDLRIAGVTVSGPMAAGFDDRSVESPARRALRELGAENRARKAARRKALDAACAAQDAARDQPTVATALAEPKAANQARLGSADAAIEASKGRLASSSARNGRLGPPTCDGRKYRFRR